jgi:hypothetical protein
MATAERASQLIEALLAADDGLEGVAPDPPDFWEEGSDDDDVGEAS